MQRLRQNTMEKLMQKLMRNTMEKLTEFEKERSCEVGGAIRPTVTRWPPASSK